MDRDPQTVDIIATTMGGLLWGLARLFTVAFPPVPASPRAIKRALVELVLSTISAVIAGLYVVPAAILWMHIGAPELRGLVSVIIGIMFWQSIPAFARIAEAGFLKRLASVVGVSTQDTAQ